MEDFANFRRALSKHGVKALFGKITDGNDPLRSERVNYSRQVAIASRYDWRSFASRKLVGGAVTTAGLIEAERAIVRDEMFAEKLFGCFESSCEQAPEP